MLRLGWSEAGEPPCPRGAGHGTEPPLPHRCGATGETLPLARSLFQFPQELRDSPQPVGARQQGDSPVPHPAVTLEALTASPSSVQPSEQKGRAEPSPRSFSSSQSADNSVLSRLFNISYKAHTHTHSPEFLLATSIRVFLFLSSVCVSQGSEHVAPEPGVVERGSCPKLGHPHGFTSPRRAARRGQERPRGVALEQEGCLSQPYPGLDAAGTAEGLASTPSKWLPA